MDLAVHMSQARLFGSICLNMAICVCVCVFKCFWDRIYAPWKVDGVIPPPAKIESIKARKNRRDLMCNGGHILILGPFWIVLVE